ncbi:hypothetical protein Drorol1_Dr00006567 [Drosera rotundifolia]
MSTTTPLKLTTAIIRYTLLKSPPLSIPLLTFLNPPPSFLFSRRGISLIRSATSEHGGEFVKRFPTRLSQVHKLLNEAEEWANGADAEDQVWWVWVDFFFVGLLDEMIVVWILFGDVIDYGLNKSVWINDTWTNEPRKQRCF